MSIDQDKKSAQKNIVLSLYIALATIFSLIGLVTIIPLRAMLAVMVMATDSCHSINPIYDLIWSASIYGLLPLVVIGIITMWYAVAVRSVTTLIVGALLPLLIVLLQVGALISLKVLGC